jgi:hypothetical protein
MILQKVTSGETEESKRLNTEDTEAGAQGAQRKDSLTQRHGGCREEDVQKFKGREKNYDNAEDAETRSGGGGGERRAWARCSPRRLKANSKRSDGRLKCYSRRTSSIAN